MYLLLADIMDIDMFHSSTGLPDFRSIGISGYGLNLGYHFVTAKLGSYLGGPRSSHKTKQARHQVVVS